MATSTPILHRPNPKNLDLEYFREDNFHDYKIYLVYKTEKYENNEWFRGVVDNMVEFYG